MTSGTGELNSRS